MSKLGYLTATFELLRYYKPHDLSAIANNGCHLKTRFLESRMRTHESVTFMRRHWIAFNNLGSASDGIGRSRL